MFKNWISKLIYNCTTYIGINFVVFLVYMEDKKEILFKKYPKVKMCYSILKSFVCNDTTACINKESEEKYEYVFNDEGKVLYTIWTRNNLKKVTEGEITEECSKDGNDPKQSEVKFLLVEGHTEDEKIKIEMDEYMCVGNILSKKLLEYIMNKKFLEVEILDGDCKMIHMNDEKIIITEKAYEIA